MEKIFSIIFPLKRLPAKSLKIPVKTGKRIAGAEFCAPMEAMYGHVAWLMDKVDYIFSAGLS